MSNGDAALKTREHLVQAGTRRRKGSKLKKVAGVTIHNTGNSDKGANADRHAKYQANTPNDAVNGWHWTVDEKEAVLSIPEDEIAEHAGRRAGNDTTVGIEICENPDGDILKATDNAAKLTAQVLKRQGFDKAVWKENLYQHNDWSGKDCPARIRRKQPYDWGEFVRKVNAEMGNGNGAVPDNKVEVDNETVGKFKPYIARVTAYILNIRKGPGTDNDVNGQIRDRGSYTIVAEGQGPGAKKWGKLKDGRGWISLDFTEKVREA